MNQINIKSRKLGSREQGVTNVNRSDNICSNRISANYYGDNGGVKNGNDNSLYCINDDCNDDFL